MRIAESNANRIARRIEIGEYRRAKGGRTEERKKRRTEKAKSLTSEEVSHIRRTPSEIDSGKLTKGSGSVKFVRSIILIKEL
jgi:hypothetical protein